MSHTDFFCLNNIFVTKPIIMKYKLLSFLLTCSFSASAQIVDIPNSAFKNVLLNPEAYTARNGSGTQIIIDANEDNEIQLSEALLVAELYISGHNLGNLEGLHAFQNLWKLHCYGNQLTSLNLQGMEHLLILDCRNNLLTDLNLSNISTLEQVRAGENPLVNINIDGLPNLEYLILDLNDLTSLDYSGAPNIRFLDVAYGNFTSLNISGLQQLETLALNGCQQLTSATFANLPMLDEIWFDFCALQSVELINLPQLSTVLAEGNQLSTLNLSSCTSVDHVFAQDNQLVYLNVKNGPHIITTLNVTNNFELDMVCVDEGEEMDIQTNLMMSNQVDVELTNECPDTIAHNIINGTVSYSENNDCDAGTALSLRKVVINNGATSRTLYTNNAGSYSLHAQTGNFTIVPQGINEWFTVSPVSASVSFDNVDSTTSTHNFCMVPQGVHYDAEVVIVPLNGARPGFDAAYKIVYKNNGTEPLSGSISLQYDDFHTDFISALPAADNAPSGMLTWNFINLQPAETKVILLIFNVNGPMETPPVNIDDVLNYTATISIPVEDAAPYNNMLGIKQVVVGSLDPNDITCLEGNVAAPEAIGEYLHYNINFENIGTAPATFVIVENDINAEEFDITTLEMLYASHNMAATLEGNKLTCRFDDINLGPNAKGNIVYKVKTLNVLQVGDDVMQKANIFFDYNFPLATNEATTTFAILSTGDFEVGSTLKLYPNPSEGLVNITADDIISGYELYDIQGRLLQSAIVNDTNAKLDISQRAAGIYFLKVTTTNGVKTEKIVRK